MVCCRCCKGEEDKVWVPGGADLYRSSQPGIATSPLTDRRCNRGCRAGRTRGRDLVVSARASCVHGDPNLT